MLVDDRVVVSEHFLEIRYKPLARVLDMRGRIADHVADHTDLSFWAITENRVDFRVSEKLDRERAYVSHRNVGYSLFRPETRNFFPDRAVRFLRELLRVDGFEIPPVTRFGVRSKMLVPHEGTFEALVARVNRVFPTSEALIQPYRAQVEDVGPVLVLKRGRTRIKVGSGPMTSEQAEGQHFRERDGLPKVGFFLDQDFYQNDVGRQTERDVVALLREFHSEAWTVLDAYNRMLF